MSELLKYVVSMPPALAVEVDALAAGNHSADGCSGAAQLIVSRLTDTGNELFPALNTAVLWLSAAELTLLSKIPGIATSEDVEFNLPANTFAPGNIEPHLQDIGLSNGITLTGKGVKVAVLDSGIDHTHPDFGHLGDIKRESFIPGDPLTMDIDGHGTHCCGLIAGAPQPQTGPRYSVAPGCTLIVGRIIGGGSGCKLTTICTAMQWAADEGAKIISISIGKRRNKNSAYDLGVENRAAALLARGILTVAAAGNGGDRDLGNIEPIMDPAAAPSVAAVAAVRRDFNGVAVLSNSCGDDKIARVDLSAPGNNIRSADLQHGYAYRSGTSSACPQVAGIAALLMEKNPHLEGRALWLNLISTTRDLGEISGVGAGLVQAP